jgi:hypothetical protein
MSGMGQNHSPYSARPWFIALAMTLGVSAMAFGAYTVENPNAFTTKTSGPMAVQPPPNAGNRGPAPATEIPKDSPLTLDAVKITARLSRRQGRPIQNPNACAPDWRELASGPAARQVREFCPGASLDAVSGGR